MRRRVAATTLIAVGGLLCSFAGGRYALGAVAQVEARQAWNAKDANSAVALARLRAQVGDANPALLKGAPVAHLIIPKIALDEIVLEGVDDDTMNGGPGHVPGSPLPGDVGNSVVSAHRDRHFRSLGELAIGDTIRTEAGSITATWVIASRRVVDKAAPALFRSRERRLTLTTCWPIRYLGTAPDRLILTAKLANSKKS